MALCVLAIFTVNSNVVSAAWSHGLFGKRPPVAAEAPKPCCACEDCKCKECECDCDCKDCGKDCKECKDKDCCCKKQAVPRVAPKVKADCNKKTGT